MCRGGGAVADEAEDVVEGRVVAELELVVAFDAVFLADGGEQFGLLDGVDAEVGFEVEVEGQHLGGVAGLFGDEGHDACGDGVDRHGRRRDDGATTAGASDDRRRGDRSDGSGVSAAGVRRWRDRGRAVIDQPQPALHHLELGGGIAADARQPAGEPRRDRLMR